MNQQSRQPKRWLRRRGLLAFCAVVGAGVAATAFGSAAATAHPAHAAATSVLGTPHRATGTPYVMGMINQELGPAVAPEGRLGAQAAIDYVNNYLDGINGHPIQLTSCPTDAQPATSQNCANQIVDKHPLMILGAADAGAAGSFPVYQRANLAYVGGIPLSPVESNASNAVIFNSIVVADNAAAISYVAKKYKIKRAAILELDDSEGHYVGAIVAADMKAHGITANVVLVSPTAADLTAPAASALSGSPQLIFDITPNACAAAFKALQSVGYKGKLAGLDTCTAPAAIAASGSAANGLYFAQPYQSLSSGTKQAKLATAIFAKYAPKTMAVDTTSLAGLSSVINIHNALSKVKGKLTTKKILAAFTTGANHPNFLGHGYTCNRTQVPGQAASCDAYQLIKEVKGGRVVTVSGYIDAFSAASK